MGTTDEPTRGASPRHPAQVAPVIAGACGESDSPLEEKRATRSDGGDGDDGPTGYGLEEGEEVAFGWTPHVDAATGKLCYVHSHTGEVRWPQRARSDGDVSSVAFAPTSYPYDGPWSPTYPQLVMLPTGITPTRPPSSRIDSWRGGYARYPLYHASWGILEEMGVPEDQAAKMMQFGRRVLPCTWESSNHGPPFLGPFPVVILSPISRPEPPASATYPSVASETEVWWPSPQAWYPAYTSPAHTSIAPAHCFPISPFQAPGIPYAPEYAECAPQFGEKAHNRRGYGIRQARKLMKELGLQPKKPKKPCQTETKTSSPLGHLSPPETQSTTRVDELPGMRPAAPAIRAN